MNRVLRYFVTALIVSLGAVIGSARAQGGYGLYILGKEVTPANCGDLSTLDTERIKVQSGGEFKYDPASNTLFMKGVTIAGEEGADREQGAREFNYRLRRRECTEVGEQNRNCLTQGYDLSRQRRVACGNNERSGDISARKCLFNDFGYYRNGLSWFLWDKGASW